MRVCNTCRKCSCQAMCTNTASLCDHIIVRICVLVTHTCGKHRCQGMTTQPFALSTSCPAIRVHPLVTLPRPLCDLTNEAEGTSLRNLHLHKPSSKVCATLEEAHSPCPQPASKLTASFPTRAFS